MYMYEYMSRAEVDFVYVSIPSPVSVTYGTGPDVITRTSATTPPSGPAHPCIVIIVCAV